MVIVLEVRDRYTAPLCIATECPLIDIGLYYVRHVLKKLVIGLLTNIFFIEYVEAKDFYRCIDAIEQHFAERGMKVVYALKTEEWKWFREQIYVKTGYSLCTQKKSVEEISKGFDER